ncbi:PilN domain-containing protein [Lysinibacillus sp. NPDC097214]|uniref:PilN domain-containing protein n=1 Tax=Lysinibacillus sp. NPDC097214 TaxID=3390584 RepID=UPI003D03FCBA
MVPDINLLPQLEKRADSPKLFYSLLILVVGIVLTYLVFLYFTAKSDLSMLLEEEQSLTTQVEQLQQELDAKQSVNQGSLEESMHFVQSVSYPVSPLMDEAQKLLPAYSKLRSYEFGQDSINITVDFESMPDISKYVERLLGSLYFTDAQINSLSNFYVQVGAEQELTPEQKFKEIPRYSVSITATVDQMYLAGGRSS